MDAKLLFVCHGNICRSAMAEQVARAWADEAGQPLHVDSVGVSDEEEGNPIDPRAARTLGAHGYPVGEHTARQVTPEDLHDSDLVLAFEPRHLRALRRMVPEAGQLVTDFDPTATPGSGIADPWYGGPEDFDRTLAEIEAALPAIFEKLGLTVPSARVVAD